SPVSGVAPVFLMTQELLPRLEWKGFCDFRYLSDGKLGAYCCSGPLVSPTVQHLKRIEKRGLFTCAHLREAGECGPMDAMNGPLFHRWLVLRQWGDILARAP